MRGLPLGYTQNHERIRYERRKGFQKRPGESSGIIIGPARTGKGTDIIMPMLIEYEGSVICLDPKGQNACITARHRQKSLGQDVFVLNPFREWPDFIGGIPNVGINPLESLDPASPSFAIDCDALAEGIVPVKLGEREPHFPESAQQAISGTIMAIAIDAPPAKRNLASVYEIITGPKFFDFAKDAIAINSLVAGRLGRFAAEGAAESKELTSILSTAITNCRFIGNQAMMQSLSGEIEGQRGLRWRQLRKRPTTVYVILPVRYLTPCARWMRLCIASALNELLVEEHGGNPVLLLMDEFAALGHMAVIENSMSLSAGMGLTMLPVLQDLPQLKELYKERMSSFLSMAGFQVFLTPRDLTTAQTISELSGQTEVVAQSRSVTLDPLTGEPHVTDSASQQARRVLLPDEVMALPCDEMLLRVENVPDMIRARRRPYYESPEYRGLYAPDPYHLQMRRR